MDFFNGFSHQPRRTGLAGFLLTALVGAIIGGLVVAVIVVRVVIPGLDLAPHDPGVVPGSNVQQPEIPFNENDLPEYQNTAIVRAAQRVMPAVVGITNKAMVYDMWRGRSLLQDKATGSGVIIDAAGYIVTNNHVIDGAAEIYVTLGDGTEHRAELIGADAATDLAVIKIDETSLPVAALGDSDKIVVGEQALAIGNPLGLNFSQTLTVGYISAKSRTITMNEYTFNFIQTDAAINDGNSGGALVNLQGEVIGINTAKIKIAGVEGMGFAIPSNTVKTITQELIEHGKIIRPWLGIYAGGDIDDTLAQQLQLPVNYGVLVQDVVPGSPADRAGIRRGDVIIEMAGEKVTKFRDLRDLIYKQKVNAQVEIKLVRDGKEIKTTATLTEMEA
ncbi:MAG: S1C family serine protease [Dethiobacteraceae bacterium]|jgi:serine protease Do|nr:trypsin-like serine protease [Bacillota bacterium]